MTQTGEVAVSPAVQASNALTARWAERLGEQDFVCSGAGLWPLLALLVSAADGEAAAELAGALGRPADTAAVDALELIELLASGVSTSAALGFWARKGVALQEDWASQLPEGVVGILTDQAALDRWTAEKTGGMIENFPLELTAKTLLVLASALTAKVKWRKPFDAEPRNPRSRKPAPADEQWLSRSTSDLSIVAVLDDAVTRVVVEGDGDVDVHLLLGVNQNPGEILATGIRALAGQSRVRPAAEVTAGPGFVVERIKLDEPRDIVRLRLPSFQISLRHDLMKHADLFGLRLVSDPQISHLPRLSPEPLYVSDGAQSVLARFFAEGFEAAAVTAFGLMTGVPLWEHEVTLLQVRFDRPFGFLAVHRPSRLAVVAGWVSSAVESGDYNDEEEEEDKFPVSEEDFSEPFAIEDLDGVDYGYSDYR